MAEVVLSGVRSVPHEGRRALDGVDLAVADGEVLALLGGSGSGKTTLLRVIAGLAPCDGGSVRIGDRDMAGIPTRERDLAMVVQDEALLPHLTARRNIGFGLRLRRMARREVDRRVEDVSRVIGVRRLLDKRPNALSGGERQSTAVARATVRAPAVYLLDEPFARLDPAERARLRTELVRLVHQRGTTALLVTNDPVEALVAGDRVAVLEGGRIAQVATPEELYARPATVAVAQRVGDPPMAVLPGVLEPGGRTCWVRLGDQRVPVPRPAGTLGEGAAVLVGLRAEHVLPAGGAAGLEAEVRHLERLGSHTLVHLAVPGVPAPLLLARFPGPAALAPGERTTVAVRAGTAVLFDPETEAALPLA